MSNKEFMLSGPKALSAMIVLASVEHNSQFDLGGNPYILHPLAVMHLNPDFDWDQHLCYCQNHSVSALGMVHRNAFDAVYWVF